MAKPFQFEGIELFHVPIAREPKPVGVETSARKGFGLEIDSVRPLEPGEAGQFYSPQLSAQFGKPHGVFFCKMQQVRVFILADLTPAVDFGEPSKRQVMVKLASTLSNLTVLEPNNGSAWVVGIGERVRFSDEVSDEAAFRGALFAIERGRKRTASGGSARALRQICGDNPECLIFLLSDFLLPPDDPEWDALERVYRIATHAGHEIVCIRVIDRWEDSMPTRGSVTIESADGAFWSSSGVNDRLRMVNRVIRERLLALAGDAKRAPESHIRFLEVMWEGDGVGVRSAFLRFLKTRMRYVRSRSSASA
ncbi:MAG: hypothetical protein HYT22_00075 [Candidatus Niyogibacteria bacterium]|nr:hypothetical protein [Candidatus Niyogibacteria bacterium]